jgi:RNA polymerase sigma-70 factor (ECF subfamily)
MQARKDDRKAVEQLVRQAQEGHQPAFAALYEMYYDQIFRYVSFKCGSPSESEDITGEVFLKMLVSIDRFRWQGHPFTSWLYRIAHNLVVDHFRKNGARPTLPLEAALNTTGASASDLEYLAEISLTMSDVVLAMEDLTDLQREVIALRFASGLSTAETAATIGKKDNAVKALQHAGLKKLRQALAPPTPMATAVANRET